MLQNKAFATASPPRGAEPAARPETVIGKDVLVEGDLKSPLGVEVLGTVEGGLEVGGSVVVGESGRVLGDVTAREVIVDGSIEGQVTATGRIELRATGRVEGDLQARAVSIADGAYFVGRVEMSTDSDPEPESKGVPVAQPAAVG